MEKVNEVRVEVSATDAARIAAGSAQYDMERAALLGCHNQECAGVVTTIPLEAESLDSLLYYTYEASTGAEGNDEWGISFFNWCSG